MHRFFVSKDLANRLDFEITNLDDVKHALKVLRVKSGDLLEVADEKAQVFLCEVINFDEKILFCKKIKKLETNGESPVSITLFQGLPKGEKMDMIVQKSVELGVHTIVPVIMERSVSRWKPDKSGLKKQSRWNRIAYEAAKQAKRGCIPTVSTPISLLELCKQLGTYESAYFFYEGTTETVLSSNKGFKGGSVATIVGPEGGFESGEVQLLKEAGAICVGLGPRILRTETAGIVSVALLQYILGDLGT